MNPTDKFVQKLRARRPVTDRQQTLIEGLSDDVRFHKRGTDLAETGEQPGESLLVIDGVSCRYKDFADGRRQIIEMNVPGDFIDLHAYVLNRLDHSIMVLSDCHVLHVPHEKIRDAMSVDVDLAEIIWHQTIIDAAIHREWVCSLGIRSATERLAAFFCELTVRLSVVGIIDGFRYPFKLSQSDLSDFCGMTHVHTNRTLGVMDRANLLRFRHEEVEILDWPALKEVAAFDYTYLDLPDGYALPFG
ncbi:MAG: Crp/Fnr family transcriptional regulator [Pacificimonas sp.]